MLDELTEAPQTSALARERRAALGRARAPSSSHRARAQTHQVRPPPARCRRCELQYQPTKTIVRLRARHHARLACDHQRGRGRDPRRTAPVLTESGQCSIDQRGEPPVDRRARLCEHFPVEQSRQSGGEASTICVEQPELPLRPNPPHATSLPPPLLAPRPRAGQRPPRRRANSASCARSRRRTHQQQHPLRAR